MYRKRNLLLLFFACVVLLSGCARVAAVPISETEPIAPYTPTPFQLLETDWAGLLDFSSRLFAQVLAEGERNPVISPLSAYFALAMTALGAAGDAAEEFYQVLGRDAHTLARELASLHTQLTRTYGRTVISLANSIWLCNHFTVRTDFNHTARRFFDAPARARDFSSHATVDEINAWADEQTMGLIPEVIEEICDDTIMLLINTLYLLARWQSPMVRIAEAPFYPADTPVYVPFLEYDFWALPVIANDYFQAALLTYDDRRTGFFLLMPTDGTCLREFAASHCMIAAFHDLENRDGMTRLRMPELDKDFEIMLNDILQDMGLTAAFEEAAEPLPYLVYENDLPPFISEVRQVVRMMVDRYGTEAAAATIVDIFDSAPLPPSLYLYFDRPFLYGVFDLTTGIPLFMGAVDNPAQ